jgi:hypothetical protein
MKVLEKAYTPDGILIQLEDWSENYSFMNTYNIGAYPKAKNSSKYQWIKAGYEFRLDIHGFNSNEEAEQVFNDLITGKRKLTDLADLYWNGNKDKYYMGLIDTF